MFLGLAFSYQLLSQFRGAKAQSDAVGIKLSKQEVQDNGPMHCFFSIAKFPTEKQIFM